MPADSPSLATIRPLSEVDARALLARQRVGRLAFSYRDRVDIEPIHYVADGDWIYGRTGVGTKLSVLAHHPWCAFEVDDVRDTFDWTSVVVKGAFYLVDPAVAPDVYDRALALIRGETPASLRADDPAPQRTTLFRIHISEITGRTASMRGR